MALATTTYSSSPGRNGRRPSAASVSVTSGGNGNFFLSPNSVFPEGFRPERRRKSYAGDNQIPDLFIYSPEAAMSPTLTSHGGGFGASPQQVFFVFLKYFKNF